MVEELLAARGIIVSHETVRQWARKFGQQTATAIRRSRRLSLELTSSRPPATTTARPPGAGSRTPSSSSPTRPHPAQSTDLARPLRYNPVIQLSFGRRTEGEICVVGNGMRNHVNDVARRCHACQGGARQGDRLHTNYHSPGLTRTNVTSGRK
jgi:hypothetical protein